MDFKRFIEAKLRAARRGSIPDTAVSPSAARIPAGQKQVSNFPVLDLGTRPKIPSAQYVLHVDGLVARPRIFTWADLQQIGMVSETSDFHCVTRWSRLDTAWSGVRLRDLLERVAPAPEAEFVMAHAADGYETNLPLSRLRQDDVLLATALDGKTIPTEHGGPVRLVVPSLYGWKSAKWVVCLEFMAVDRPGFWEQRGYHNDGDPWREQRFARGR